MRCRELGKWRNLGRSPKVRWDNPGVEVIGLSVGAYDRAITSVGKSMARERILAVWDFIQEGIVDPRQRRYQ